MAPADKKDGAESPPADPDWSEIYTDLLCHTSMHYDEIRERSLPQIEAIRKNLGKNIALKVGMPGMFGVSLDVSSTPPENTGKPPKLSEFMDFANAFNGI